MLETEILTVIRKLSWRRHRCVIQLSKAQVYSAINEHKIAKLKVEIQNFDSDIAMYLTKLPKNDTQVYKL